MHDHLRWQRRVEWTPDEAVQHVDLLELVGHFEGHVDGDGDPAQDVVAARLRPCEEFIRCRVVTFIRNSSDVAGWDQGHDEDVEGEEKTMHEDFFNNVEADRELEDVERTVARTLGAEMERFCWSTVCNFNIFNVFM